MRASRLIGVVLLAMSLVSCGGADSGTGPVTPPANPTDVDIRDNLFNPTATTVPVGSTVTWTWRGTQTHDVFFDSGISSGAKASGTYSRTFAAAGTYDYICSIHGSAMSGRVVVQ